MLDKCARITIGTHFFKVTHFDESMRKVIYDFLKNYVKYSLEKIPRTNRYRNVASAVYAAATKERDEFRFHINQYEKFKRHLHLNFIADGALNFVTLPVPEADPLNCDIRSHWKVLEHQEPIIEYLTKTNEPTDDIIKFNSHRSKLVGIQTGKGKTFTAMKAAAMLGVRLAIVVRPMFIYKWVNDVEKCLEINPAEEIMVVQGLKDLMGVFEQQKQGLLDKIKVFIISNKTLQIWFKQYQEYGENVRDLGYGITPEEMYGHLKVGLRIIDEVHLDFHLNFKIDLYSNVANSISLSATLDNKDSFLKEMYELAYPPSQRLKEQAIDKYAIARCITYSINDNPEKIRCSEHGSNSYSHNAFEDYLIKRPEKLNNYLKLIKYAVDIGFMDKYVPGERCVIFAYKKDMCSIIVEYLNKAYPNLDIRRYVSEDPDENMYDPVIRVTTIGSGSTGHDITRLKTAIMTVNVDSLQANIQAFGRLRKIDDLTTRFFYFTCLDIPKHMQYHKAKVELLKTRALNFNIYQAPFRI